MAKMEITGVDEYIAKLDKIRGRHAEEFIGKAIYEGAKIVADEIKRNIQRLPEESRTEWHGSYSYDHAGHQDNGITATQKQGLLDGFGIAKMKRDGGTFDVKAGFHGYNAQKTQKYPNGQPNAMIARVVEGGTSHSAKHPFVGPAVRKSRKSAEAKMVEVIEQGISKVMEE